MNTLNLVALGVLALVLAAFLVLLPVAIIFNMKTGMKYRQELAHKLDRLRLGKMLAALGMDLNEYLATNPTVDIKHQMERCTACTNTEECDDQLAINAIDADSIGFCNNEESLRHIVNTPVK
jgi:hypothetical protein